MFIIEWIRDQAAAFDALLAASGAGVRSPRNFERCILALDVTLEPLSPASDADLVHRGATLSAVDIARDAWPGERLAAGTVLVLVDGTNAGCGEGWEQSVYRVASGPRTGSRIAFSDDLRLGIEPALARTCLRKAGARLPDDAARERLLDWRTAIG